MKQTPILNCLKRLLAELEAGEGKKRTFYAVDQDVWRRLMRETSSPSIASMIVVDGVDVFPAPTGKGSSTVA